MTYLHNMLVYGLEYFGLYYGTYRGVVKDNQDPKGLGRVQVHCQALHGKEYPQVWAWPMAGMAGDQTGLWHVPDIGEWVYVCFDHGRLDYPLWKGGWWGAGNTTDDMTARNVVLCTKEGLKIVLNRDAKTVLVQNSKGFLLITEDQIILNHDSDVRLLSKGDVDVIADGDVRIQATGNIELTAPSVKITGNVDITGDVTITGAGVIQPAPWSTPL